MAVLIGEREPLPVDPWKYIARKLECFHQNPAKKILVDGARAASMIVG